MDGSQGRILTVCSYLGREWQTTFVYLLENPVNSMKRQKDGTLKDELPWSVGDQYATGDQWRNNSRKNEETEPKQKQHPVVGVTGDRSNVRYYKEQYCIGTWNVRSLDQGKLDGQTGDCKSKRQHFRNQ